MKLSSLKSDQQREEQGIWQDIPDFPGLSLKVRPLDYGPYVMARDVVLQRFVRKFGRRPIPPEERTREFGKLYAQFLLLDWKGIEDDSGAALPYSPELAAEYLSDMEYRRLIAAVEWASATVAEDDAEFLEDAAKNSERPSVTT